MSFNLVFLITWSLMLIGAPAHHSQPMPAKAPPATPPALKRLTPDERIALIRQLDSPLEAELANRLRELGPRHVPGGTSRVAERINEILQ